MRCFGFWLLVVAERKVPKKSCSQVSPEPGDPDCFDKCVDEKLRSRERPPYGGGWPGITPGGGGTDCQEWNDDVVSSCQAACNPPTPQPGPPR